MSRIITGTFTNPCSGGVLANIDIEFIAKQSSPTAGVPFGASCTFQTDGSGVYNQVIENGQYTIYYSQTENNRIKIGTAVVNDGADIDILNLIGLGGSFDPDFNLNLADLLDVDATNKANGKALVFRSASNKHEYETVALASTLTTKGDIFVATGAGTLVRVGVGADGQVITADAAEPSGIKWADGGGGGAADYILIRDEKASGTAGGASSAGDNLRTLTRIVSDVGGHASLSLSTVTLSAGTYEFRVQAPTSFGNANNLRLYNVTDAADIVDSEGTNDSAPGAGFGYAVAVSVGRFELAAPKGVRVVHYIQSFKATDGLGKPATTGRVEVYCTLELWKVA